MFTLHLKTKLFTTVAYGGGLSGRTMVNAISQVRLPISESHNSEIEQSEQFAPNLTKSFLTNIALAYQSHQIWDSEF